MTQRASINGKMPTMRDAVDLGAKRLETIPATEPELRAELLLTTAVAQRLGVGLAAAYVPETFTQVNRSLFDREYMEALYNLGVERAKAGTAFEIVTTKSLDLRSGTR